MVFESLLSSGWQRLSTHCFQNRELHRACSPLFIFRFSIQNNNHNMRKATEAFLFLVVASTIVSGLVLVAVQQNYRQSANDPQIQDARDVVTALNAGQQLNLAPDGTDVATSLSPFIMLFDKDGNALGSNATLNGNMPQLPKGVFAWVDKHGEDRFTWQPQPGIREAVVVDKANVPDQYVAIARSLLLVEQRENLLTGYVAIAWTLLVLLSLAATRWFYYGCSCFLCRRKGKKGEDCACDCESCKADDHSHHAVAKHHHAEHHEAHKE